MRRSPKGGKRPIWRQRKKIAKGGLAIEVRNLITWGLNRVTFASAKKGRRISIGVIAHLQPLTTGERGAPKKERVRMHCGRGVPLSCGRKKAMGAHVRESVRRFAKGCIARKRRTVRGFSR